jgi:hypothetical protein
MKPAPEAGRFATIFGQIKFAGNAPVATEFGCSSAFFTNILGSKYLLYAAAYRGTGGGRGLGAFFAFCLFFWLYIRGRRSAESNSSV